MPSQQVEFLLQALRECITGDDAPCNVVRLSKAEAMKRRITEINRVARTAIQYIQQRPAKKPKYRMQKLSVFPFLKRVPVE